MYPTNEFKRAASCLRRRAAPALACLVLLAGCAREERAFRDGPPLSRFSGPAQIELVPGTPRRRPPMANPFEGNAHALAEGRRLYGWFNCSGCHFNGGGGIGPPLMDDQWIYGSEPLQVFSSIVEGRPNGMPAFGERLNDRQVWQIVAFVRSLGQLPAAGDAPGRAGTGGPPADAATPQKSSGE